MPSVQEIVGFYPPEYYGQPSAKFQRLVERLVRWVSRRHLAFLSQGLAPGDRVLDVGCGRGVVVEPLADRGFELHGVEISSEAARGVDPRAEIRIAPHLADARYPDGYFQEVILWHVLEHLDDPAGTLAEVHRILRPGGRLVVAVPNFSSAQARWSGAAWFHLDLPRHLYHFPLPGLRRLLVDTGFLIESEHHFSLRQNPFGWIQSGLNRVALLPRNGLYTLLHRRPPEEPPPFDTRTRFWLRFWLVVGVLPALLAAVAAAGLRTGATVHVVASAEGARSEA
jgi:SAM-dependent methyltransferase